MLYTQHDLLKNLESAKKAGDYESVIKIITGEIGQLMSNDKPALIAVVRNSGKEIANDISDKELANLIAIGLIKQKDFFIENLMTAILTDKARYSNGDWIGEIVGAVGNITTAGINLGIAKTNAKAGIAVAREGTQQATLNARAAQIGLATQIMGSKSATDNARLSAQVDLEKAKLGGKSTMMIVLVIGGIALLGAFIYMNKQNASGGAVVASPTA